MLTASSPEIAGNLYGERHEFAYPFDYTEVDLRRDMGKSLADNEWGHNPLVISPWQAMVHWHESLPGQHQSGQVARFAGFHADLKVPRELGVPQDSLEANAARHDMLEFMAEHAGANMHPVGHAAVYFASLAYAVTYSPFTTEPIFAADPLDRAIARQQPVHHDTPETLHPGVILACGGAIGDLATGTKTTVDEALEHDILQHQLEAQYGDVYPPEVRARLVRFIRHEVAAMTPSERGYHTLAEAIHDLGHRETASQVYEAAFHAPAWMKGVAVRLAYDVERHTTHRLQQAQSELPHMRDYINERARVLDDQLSGSWSWETTAGKRQTSTALMKRWGKARQL